jgi:hypothetical protein
METGKLFKKLIAYLILLVAGFGFVYFLLSAGLNVYVEGKIDFSDKNSVQQSLILPIVFSFLCLLVSGLDQFLLIQINEANEKRIYGIALMVYFGALLALSLAFFIRSLASNGTILALLSVPTMAVELAEIVYGLLTLLAAQKALKAEPVSEQEAK